MCMCAFAAGVDGFIIVDLPPEEATFLSSEAKRFGISYIPLVSPTTTESRMRVIASVAHGFVYCVSLTGVTGERSELPPNLDAFMAKSTSGLHCVRCLSTALSLRMETDTTNTCASPQFVRTCRCLSRLALGSRRASTFSKRVRSQTASSWARRSSRSSKRRTTALRVARRTSKRSARAS